MVDICEAAVSKTQRYFINPVLGVQRLQVNPLLG